MACLGLSYKILSEFKVCIIAALEWWKQDELHISTVCKYCEYDKEMICVYYRYIIRCPSFIYINQDSLMESDLVSSNYLRPWIVLLYAF